MKNFTYSFPPDEACPSKFNSDPATFRVGDLVKDLASERLCVPFVVTLIAVEADHVSISANATRDAERRMRGTRTSRPVVGVATMGIAMAMGADRGVLMETFAKLVQLRLAKLLKAVADKEPPQLIILCKQAIDDDCPPTWQTLAVMPDWWQATFASKIELADDQVTVIREVDGGLETLAMILPARMTTDLRLTSMGVATTARPVTLSVRERARRDAGVIAKDSDALVDKLRNETKVIRPISTASSMNTSQRTRKEAVRQWLLERRLHPGPLPDLEQIRRKIGWGCPVHLPIAGSHSEPWHYT